MQPRCNCLYLGAGGLLQCVALYYSWFWGALHLLNAAPGSGGAFEAPGKHLSVLHVSPMSCSSLFLGVPRCSFAPSCSFAFLIMFLLKSAWCSEGNSKKILFLIQGDKIGGPHRRHKVHHTILVQAPFTVKYLILTNAPHHGRTLQHLHLH